MTARRALFEQLGRDPHDLTALRALCDALDAEKHGAELARIVEWWVTCAPDDQVASRVLLDAARALSLSSRCTPPRVLSLLTAALQRDPGNEEAACAIRALLERAGDHHELERLLTEWALAVRRDGCAPTLCAFASLMLGHVRAYSLADLDGGIAALLDALRAFAEHPEARRMLAELYAQRFHARQHDDDPRGREDAHRAAQLYYELALFDVGSSAVAGLLRALDLVPEHSAALDALLRQLSGEQLELRRRRLSAYVASSPDRVLTHQRRFELVHCLLAEGRPAAAVPHLRLLARRGYGEAQRMLEQLCPDAQVPERAAIPELTRAALDEDDDLTVDDLLGPSDPAPEATCSCLQRGTVREPITVIPSAARARSERRASDSERCLDCEQERTTGVYEVHEIDEDERPTDILDEATREAALRAAAAAD